MIIPQNIRSFFGKTRFRRELDNQNVLRETVGFAEAKKIGLLYDATNDDNFEIMKKYVKHVRSLQKEVFALGYVDAKELPQNKFAQYGIDFFTKKDLSWQMISRNKIVRNFIEEDFDIVANLSDNNIFPLCYIAGVSKARFRIGRYDERMVSCYEMMIQTSDNGELKQVIDQTEDYLRKIVRKNSVNS